jgi:peroxiredoxin
MRYLFIQHALCAPLLFALAMLPLQRLFAEEIIPASVLETPIETTRGDTVSLSEYQGSIVLLHFVASWCGQCMIEAPSLNRLSSAFEGEDLVVIAVSIDEEVIAAKTFSDQLMLSFPVLVDTKGILKRKFSVRGVPMTVVLDTEGSPMQFPDPASGKLVSRIEGPRDWASAAAIAGFKKLLGAPQAATQAGALL